MFGLLKRKVGFKVDSAPIEELALFQLLGVASKKISKSVDIYMYSS